MTCPFISPVCVVYVLPVFTAAAERKLDEPASNSADSGRVPLVARVRLSVRNTQSSIERPVYLQDRNSYAFNESTTKMYLGSVTFLCVAYSMNSFGLSVLDLRV